MATLCSRKGWDLAKWERLPDKEKDFWLGFEIYQRGAAEDWWANFTDLHDEDGEKMVWFAPEVVRGLIEMAKTGL